MKILLLKISLRRLIDTDFNKWECLTFERFEIIYLKKSNYEITIT